MGGIEAFFVALVILFSIVRALFRGLRAAAQWVRRSAAPQSAVPAALPPAAPQSAPPQSAPRPVEQKAGPLPSQAQAPARPVREAPAPLAPLAPAAPPALLGGPDDLLRAVILNEVLAKPLSQRRRPPRPNPPTQ